MGDTNRLEWIIFQLLVTSNSRTTDLLEMIAMDRLRPVVAGQAELQGGKIWRESFLVTEKESRYVSQNIVWIDPDYVPSALLERIVHGGEGIGHVLRASGTTDQRHMIRNGWRRTEEIVDLFGKPYRLRFAEAGWIPFKEYKLIFPPYKQCGAHILEYFNPDMLRITMESALQFTVKEGELV